MKKGKVRDYWKKAKTELEKSFSENHTPHETATSFGIGCFIVLLPLFPVGLLLLGFLGVTFDRLNKMALFAPTVILNPAVKVGFYTVSLRIGEFLFSGLSISYQNALLSEILNLGVSTLAGTLVTATLLASIGYILMYRLVLHYTD